jgi:Na+/melibiose symporter-like transporter
MTNEVVHSRELWQYSVLAVPIAFAGFPLYVLAPDYYATQHGVSLSLLGLLLLGLRAFDAIQDPFIGALSDRYRHASKWVMGIAAILLCASMYGLLNTMPIHPAAWFSLCVLVAVSAYSILSINLNTLGGLWTKNQATQTRIAALREGCGLIGLVIAVSLPALLKPMVGEQQSYFYFSLILTVFMALAWSMFVLWLTKNTPKRTTTKIATNSLRASLRATSKSTRYFLGVYGLSMLASSIPAVLVIFFVRDLLGAESLTGVFLLLYFLSGAASMPLWKILSTRYDQYRAWVAAMLLAVASFVWAFFLGSGDVWQYGMICVFSGLALGADLALPPAILADHIHQSNAEPHAATHYSLLALAAKLSLAFASAIALPLLGQTGFVPATQNSEASLLFLSAAYALIPCLLKLIAAALTARIFIYSNQGVVHESHQTHSHFRSSNHA